MHWTVMMQFRPTKLNQPIPNGVTLLDLGAYDFGQRTLDVLVAVLSAVVDPKNETMIKYRP